MGGAEQGDTSFGAVLRRWRGSRGLTQARLAEKTGLTEQAISMLERGARRAPRATTAELLAEALMLDGADREAFRAAARDEASPREHRAEPAAEPAPTVRRGRPRWRRRAAALGAVLLAGLIVAAPLAWWRPSAAPATRIPVPTTRIARLVGARVSDWRAANQDVGPLRTQRVYYTQLPARFTGSQGSQLPPGVVPIVSYRVRTTNVASYVRSVNRPLVVIFQYNPEPRMSAADFTTAFEEQSSLVHSVHNPDVLVAVSADIYQYQRSVNVEAASCGYIPPPAYVDTYLAAVYEPYLQGIPRTDHGGFVAWERCTDGQGRPRGLVEYGLGLGIQGSRSCQSEAMRTRVMRDDMAYLRDNLPGLEILEYWWMPDGTSTPCSRSWQFPAESSTGLLWRAIANRALSG
jgi:transcriptional regulator with XRE-family HTH domain